MELTTPVILPKKSITLDTKSRVMFVGSCFAEHVGEQLQHRMGDEMVDVNPFGVLYNPESISKALAMLVSDTSASNRIFKGQDGIYHSWLHTSHFSGKTEEECRQKIESRFAEAKEMLKNANLLCVTFGTTRCYCLNDGKAEKDVVANCHKEPQSRFTEYEPTLEELKEYWKQTLRLLREYNPTLQVCFTVSPYRYKKYGFHESQIQKAKLILLIDSLCKEEGCVYFPAYEIMMDELRDYRFYATDMLHPSDLAVSIITERFIDWAFTLELKEVAKQQLKEYKQKSHRQIL